MSKWNPFSKTYTIICPDGTPRVIYKNIDDAFPLKIESFETDISAKIKTENIQDAELKAKYKTKIEDLFFGLDDINKDLMVTFRSAYIAYTTNPCADSQFLINQMEKITFEHNKLKRVNFQINSLINMLENADKSSSKIIMAKYCDIISEMGLNGECQKEIIVEEIKSSSNDVKILSGGENEC